MGIGKPRFKFIRAVEGGRGWKGDVKTMYLSVDKLLHFGWQPFLTSEDAVKTILQGAFERRVLAYANHSAQS